MPTALQCACRGILRITLSRPEKLDAIDPGMAAARRSALEDEAVLVPPFGATLPAAFSHALGHFPDATFLIGPDRRLSVAQADAESARLAGALLRLGAGKGTHVGILMPNGVEWVICWLAASRIGAVVVPISTFAQAPELRWIVDHADIQVLLMSERYLSHDYVDRLESFSNLAEAATPELYLPECPSLRRVVSWGPAERPWMTAARALCDAVDVPPPRGLVDALGTRVAPSDDFMIIHTSGSTAHPKAVVHTHASAIGLSYALVASRWSIVVGGDRIYTGMPFFWLGGVNVTLLPAIFTGSAIVFPPSPDSQSVLSLFTKENVNVVTGWPSQVTSLLDAAAAAGVPLSHVRTTLRQTDADGEPIPPELIPNALGMTETFGPHGVDPRGTRLPPGKAGACGTVLPGLERKIVDPATGTECPPGAAGELYVRGFSLMRGFYKHLPSETFDRDGFYPTGDRCRIDTDGHLYFEGRIGEMIKTAGANVAPAEVEVALERIPGVREAIVVGVPDDSRGETVCAVVVPFDSFRLDGAELRHLLQGELSHFKVPRRIRISSYDDVPRTPAGKVRKALVKEWFSPKAPTPGRP